MTNLRIRDVKRQPYSSDIFHRSSTRAAEWNRISVRVWPRCDMRSAEIDAEQPVAFPQGRSTNLADRRGGTCRGDRNSNGNGGGAMRFFVYITNAPTLHDILFHLGEPAAPLTSRRPRLMCSS
jgi:hypothetical protein